MFTQNHNLNSEKLREPALQAFSLVEVLLAIVMASIMFFAVHYGVATGYVIVKVTREQLRATQVGLYRMEGIRLCNWSQVTNSTIVPKTFSDYFYPAGSGATGIVYNCNMTVSNVTLIPSPSYADKMKAVSITVNWTDTDFRRTNNRSQTLKTFVSRYGMQNYVYTH